MKTIKGRVWLLGDDFDTDRILPGYAMSEPQEMLGRFALAGEPELKFSELAREGDILAAGRNFGCGSSREQAPMALKLAGVGLVVAASFARIFYRNAINIGLPVFRADIAGLLRPFDEIEADLATGRVLLPNGEVRAQPLSRSTLKTIEAGGLIERVRLELGIAPGDAINNAGEGSAHKVE